MNYSRNNLSDAVYDVLLLHKNKKLTLENIHNEIIDKNLCDELVNYFSNNMSREILKACIEAQENWKNIIHENEYWYLDLPPYKLDEVIQKVHTLTNQHELEELIPEYGNNSLLHILCREGKYNLLKDLSLKYNIELSLRNKENKTLFNIILKNDKETMITLYEIQLNQIDKKYMSIYENLILQKNNLQEKFIIEKNNNYKLKKYISKISFYYVTSLISIIILIISFAIF